MSSCRKRKSSVKAWRQISELEVDAREPRVVADRQLLRRAESVDLRRLELAVKARVLDPAVAHRARGVFVDPLRADGKADRALHAETRALSLVPSRDRRGIAVRCDH